MWALPPLSQHASVPQASESWVPDGCQVQLEIGVRLETHVVPKLGRMIAAVCKQCHNMPQRCQRMTRPEDLNGLGPRAGKSGPVEVQDVHWIRR